MSYNAWYHPTSSLEPVMSKGQKATVFSIHFKGNRNTEDKRTGINLCSLTFDLNFCSSLLVMVSALAMIGMMFTLLSSFFMVTRSMAFKLKEEIGKC